MRMKECIHHVRDVTSKTKRLNEDKQNETKVFQKSTLVFFFPSFFFFLKDLGYFTSLIENYDREQRERNMENDI